MVKRSGIRGQSDSAKAVVNRALQSGILRHVAAPKHRSLFLPRLLAARSKTIAGQTFDLDDAWAIARQWAGLIESGALNQKETALDADFLDKIFGRCLGYPSSTDKPDLFHRRKHPSIGASATPDGALGVFCPNKPDQFVALIEIKGIGADLDHDKSSGRTPVQQLWDYLNQVPDCPWGIVSNYLTIRLYHRDRTPRAYEEFNFLDLADRDAFQRFFYVFHRDSMLGGKQVSPRTLALLEESRNRQREVGDKLYAEYSLNRQLLIEHLIDQASYSEDQAISAAQKLMDRVIFIAFCDARGLLPDQTLKRASMRPLSFTSVINPIWQQFKSLFGMIDKGNKGYAIPPFNGGLFRADPLVDNLDLPDEFPATQFFTRLDGYDFRDEVNVDVLGNLFEKSITELEKLRAVGRYAKGGPRLDPDAPEMPKSAARKRFGVYYTPPDFTELIVEQTVGRLIAERTDALATPGEKYHALRAITVCDPACGSGAFLIAAYARFAVAYTDLEKLARTDGDDVLADAIAAEHPEHIVTANLFGVDLSPEAVEITQLALWLQTARKNRSLADLSANIRCGNSLVCDPAIHPRALNWQAAFPAIFARGGFDCVIGNPPWERMKLQQREFFALGAPDIASAVNANDRKTLIARAASERPALFARFTKAAGDAQTLLDHVRAAGRFPLTAQGDVNTYMLFAELARTLVNPAGRVGLLVPSGIATDKTTADFFNNLIETQTLCALYDFENKKGHFDEVHRAFKFSVVLINGSATKTKEADFVFFAHDVEELAVKNKHVSLSARDLKLLNPNTKTCPIFRTRRDAQITKAIYRRVPILIDRNRKQGGNPWELQFLRMFDQTNNADLFRDAAQLASEGLHLEGNHWMGRNEVFLPLYEAKMIQAYDHRAAGVRVEAGNWMRQGQTDDTNLVEKQNPEFVVLPRYWVPQSQVLARWGNQRKEAFLVLKDVTSPTNQRTMIASFIPWSGVVNSAPLMLTTNGITHRRWCCLLANLNTLAYDFIARQKVGGLHLNFFIVEQLPTFGPDKYDEKCPWDKKQTLEKWISERVLHLSCTANDMLPLAQAAEFAPGIIKWNDEARAQWRAELDAAYFHLYGLAWEDVDYILSTFQGIVNEDLAAGSLEMPSAGDTRQRIRQAFEQLA